MNDDELLHERCRELARLVIAAQFTRARALAIEIAVELDGAGPDKAA